jgi:hypothetical protein
VLFELFKVEIINFFSTPHENSTHCLLMLENPITANIVEILKNKLSRLGA